MVSVCHEIQAEIFFSSYLLFIGFHQAMGLKRLRDDDGVPFCSTNKRNVDSRNGYRPERGLKPLMDLFSQRLPSCLLRIVSVFPSVYILGFGLGG